MEAEHGVKRRLAQIVAAHIGAAELRRQISIFLLCLCQHGRSEVDGDDLARRNLASQPIRDLSRAAAHFQQPLPWLESQ